VDVGDVLGHGYVVRAQRAFDRAWITRTMAQVRHGADWPAGQRILKRSLCDLHIPDIDNLVDSQPAYLFVLNCCPCVGQPKSRRATC
jgi:hypothetical protein